MKIAWFTPYGRNSSIGKFSSLVAEALVERDHSITLVSSDEHPLTEHLRPPVGVELLHWPLFETNPAFADAYDVIVYNIGNELSSHFGVMRVIDRYPGVCLFHDFYLVDLFLGWHANGVEGPPADSVVSSIYGEPIAKEFWKRIGNPEFQPWFGLHAPMTEWVSRKALAVVAHAPFYEHRLAESSAGPVRVIVTESGLYSSIPPDRVAKVGPAHKSEDLTRHMEMLVIDAAERDSLGKGARESSHLEDAPDAYAASIEPLLEAAADEKPFVDALRQIANNLRVMGVQPDEPIVERIGSEFRSLYCGSEIRNDPIKWITNMLEEPPSPSDGKQRGVELQPDSREIPLGASPRSPWEVEQPGSEVAPRSGDLHANAQLRSSSQDEQPSSELPLRLEGTREVAPLNRFVLRCLDPILSRVRRYSLRHFLFCCAEPILRHLRGYFLGDLFQRVLEIEQQAARLEDIAARLESQQAARRGDIAVIADHLARLESQFGNASRLIELLVNRNTLVLGDELVARTPYGYLLAPRDDLDLACVLAEGRPWEQATSRLLDLTLKEGMTFVDVGAHVGIHTLHAARKVAPNGTVIAFEPTPEVFQLLQRTVRLNAIDDVCKCMNIALSSSEGMSTLHVSRVRGHNSLFQLGDEEEKIKMQVRTAKFDSILHDARRIDMVKIDVEGAELEVLEGMKQALANHHDILLIVEYGVPRLQRLGISPSAWFGRFFAHGFALFALNEQAGTWREVPAEEAIQLSSTKVVFVRPETRYWAVLNNHEI